MKEFLVKEFQYLHEVIYGIIISFIGIYTYISIRIIDRLFKRKTKHGKQIK